MGEDSLEIAWFSFRTGAGGVKGRYRCDEQRLVMMGVRNTVVSEFGTPILLWL